jgi:multicomponent K+:H+ antiporter subunit D
MQYAGDTASALYQPQGYIDAVLSARPRPTATNAERLKAFGPETPK